MQYPQVRSYFQQTCLLKYQNFRNLPRHPNIVTFVGLCRNEQTIYLVSEYVSRGDLLGVLHRKQLSMETKVRLSIGIARGMSHLHAQRIIHRDLACRNILVAFNNGKYDAKITDFGLSHKGNYCSNTGFCAIRWMPPEAIHPKTNFFSEKSDVWSFGGTFNSTSFFVYTN